MTSSTASHNPCRMRLDHGGEPPRALAWTHHGRTLYQSDRGGALTDWRGARLPRCPKSAASGNIPHCVRSGHEPDLAPHGARVGRLAYAPRVTVVRRVAVSAP